MNVVTALLSFLILISCTVDASADFYKYYDESGGVNVTNDYKSIPERYRTNIKVISEKQLENKTKSREWQGSTENSRATQNSSQKSQKTPSVQNVTTAPAPISSADEKKLETKPDGSNGWFARQLPLLKILGIIALLITGFVYMGKFVSALAPRPLAIVIKVAMFAALSVYIFKGFSEKVVNAFERIKGESAVAQKAVDKRSEKIQKQAD